MNEYGDIVPDDIINRFRLALEEIRAGGTMGHALKGCMDLAADHLLEEALLLMVQQRGQIEALTPGEPRVMGYDELEDTMADRPVWYEGFLTGIPSLCMVLAKSSTEDAYRIIDFINERPRLVTRKTYGDVWRCWTDRPSETQREATPW